ncbi:hypothetical protein [Ruegeria atlantica]|uniref:hypothetical protein n=1 Tax=Ruegeria atlantica TaxID=81569 RepID=UPI00147A9E11|nr:hypothetical protein [Ruegeria atlantica]
MTNPSTSNAITKVARRVWKSAQLYVGFHKDKQGRSRDKAHVWPPKNASATIHADPSEQEAFLVVKCADKDAGEDVQIKLRPDQIIVRRSSGVYWQGIQITENCVVIRTADDALIKLNSDGSVTRQTEGDETTVEINGSVFKRTEYTEAFMSGDGVEMSRKTPNHIAAISEDGVISKAR